MLYLVGLGVYDQEDISQRGLSALRKAEKAYAEFYTSPFSGSIAGLEALIGKKVEVLSRRDIEEHAKESFLRDAAEKDVALIVGGDPMAATTHSSLVLEARKKGIEVKVIHASSVFSAVAETGLQLYKFGRTTTVPFPQKGYFPTSPYEALRENLRAGLHTLCLLDIRAEEGRYMTVGEGIQLLLEMGDKLKDSSFNKKSPCVGVARLGGDSEIRYAPAEKLMAYDFGKPPHALIVPGKLHFAEEEMLEALSHPAKN